jgi:hypothetical protein
MVSIPQTLVAGDTWQWDAEYGDYPASGWSATAYFQNAAGSFSVAATASATAHRFAKSAADSSLMVAGQYFVRVRVAQGALNHVVEEGWCEVQANPATAGGVDHRSRARRTLEAIEAFLEGNATTAQQSMSVAGRSLSRWSIAELNEWRDRLIAEVRAEDQGSAAGIGRDIKVRFDRA